jgi:hypothetical protein
VLQGRSGIAVQPESTHQAEVRFFVERRHVRKAHCRHAHLTPPSFRLTLAGESAKRHFGQSSNPQPFRLDPAIELGGARSCEILGERTAIQFDRLPEPAFLHGAFKLKGVELEVSALQRKLFSRSSNEGTLQVGAQIICCLTE